MRRKISFFSLTILLSIVLFACGTANEQQENEREDGVAEEVEERPEDDQQESNESGESDEETDETTEMELETDFTETVTREIEGMDNEVSVTNYELKPYGIAYQLDEDFGIPEVEDHKVMYTKQAGDYQVTLEVIEEVELDDVVTDVQEEMEADTFAEQGELEDTPTDVNELTGKMKYFGDADRSKGFYAYEVDEHVLLMTYEYPVEGGDGMGPLLAALQDSLTVH